jgi:hypothetical protein
MSQTTRRAQRLVITLLATSSVLVVAGCVTTGSPEGIGFREARFAEMSAIRGWQSCRDEALELDRKAREEGSSAQYLASAKVIEKCEADAGPDASKVGADERMRAYALGAQNYLKGGDVPKARETLDRLRSAYPGADLYYANGTSFIETMELLVGVEDRTSQGDLGIANVDSDLKSELRRIQYWKRN